MIPTLTYTILNWIDDTYQLMIPTLTYTILNWIDDTYQLDGDMHNWANP